MIPGPEGETGSTALRAAVDQAPECVLIADREGRFAYVNQAGCRLLRWSKTELLARSMFELVVPEDAQRLELVRQALLQGGHDTSEWRLKRADGSIVDVEICNSILADGQWNAFVRDISRRKAEEARREWLARRMDADRRELRGLFDALPMAAIWFGQDGALSANRRAEEALGRRLDPELGADQYARAVLSADGTPLSREDIPSTRALGGETVLAQELLLRRADGTSIPVLASCAPIADVDGHAVGAVALFQDLTERMRLEDAARRNERLLKAVFDLLPVAVWIADESGGIVDRNPAASRIWGSNGHGGLDHLGACKGWRLDNGGQIEAGEWALARALEQGETCGPELVRIQCFDGSFKTILSSAAPLRDEQGRISGAIAVNEDITALYEAQQNLARSEQVFRTVFDLVPVGLWIADRDGRIVSRNAAGRQIWQGVRYVRPEDCGAYRGWWVETGAPVTADEWGLTRALRHGETSRREPIRIQCFDGSFKTVLNWAAPIRASNGEISGAVAVNEDVTALHQTQEQLRAAVHDREQILAAVTHDLRNPLNAIIAATSAMEAYVAEMPQAAAIRVLLPTLTDATRHMAGLVNDLLHAAVLAGGGRPLLSIRPTTAGLILERAERSARPLFERDAIDLHVDVDGDLPVLHVDSDRILRVLANVLDNARKFTPRHGQVLVRAQAASAGVRFCISNTGSSLSVAEMQNMFRPFWQAGRGDDRGTGLGLSISRSIIESHGGTIWAEPAGGQRVRVCFVLPCDSANIPMHRPANGGS